MPATASDLFTCFPSRLTAALLYPFSALKSQRLPKGPAYLLIMSTHDAALPASLGSKMSKHLEDPSALTTHVVQGAGHWIHLEQPALTVQLIRKWLETQVGWGRAGHL